MLMVAHVSNDHAEVRRHGRQTVKTHRKFSAYTLSSSTVQGQLDLKRRETEKVSNEVELEKFKTLGLIGAYTT